MTGLRGALVQSRCWTTATLLVILFTSAFAISSAADGNSGKQQGTRRRLPAHPALYVTGGSLHDFASSAENVVQPPGSRRPLDRRGVLAHRGSQSVSAGPSGREAVARSLEAWKSADGSRAPGWKSPASVADAATRSRLRGAVSRRASLVDPIVALRADVSHSGRRLTRCSRRGLTALSSGAYGLPPACQRRSAAVEGVGSRRPAMWSVTVPLLA